MEMLQTVLRLLICGSNTKPFHEKSSFREVLLNILRKKAGVKAVFPASAFLFLYFSSVSKYSTFSSGGRVPSTRITGQSVVFSHLSV